MNRFGRTNRAAYASAVLILLALVAWPSAADARRLRCEPVTKDQIAKLFDRWNDALQRSNPNNTRPVVDLYAEDAILLPTVQIGPYTTREKIAGYFEHFLKNKPSGAIDGPHNIRLGCNMAFDAGLYNFTFKCPQPPEKPDPDCKPFVKARYTYVYKYDGRKWLIAHHHSSVQPEEKPH